jgi:hypothetical protein
VKFIGASVFMLVPHLVPAIIRALATEKDSPVKACLVLGRKGKARRGFSFLLGLVVQECTCAAGAPCRGLRTFFDVEDVIALEHFRILLHVEDVIPLFKFWEQPVPIHRKGSPDPDTGISSSPQGVVRCDCSLQCLGAASANTQKRKSRPRYRNFKLTQEPPHPRASSPRTIEELSGMSSASGMSPQWNLSHVLHHVASSLPSSQTTWFTTLQK